MTNINPYLQATANFAHAVAKEGEEAVINGTFDKFIDRLAKFQAHMAHTSGVHFMDYSLYDDMPVSEFMAICMAYGIYEAHIGPNARDWFVTNYKRYYQKFEGWEGSDSECL